MDVEQEIEKIKDRNERVELDKAWETSNMRRICICINIYNSSYIFSTYKYYIKYMVKFISTSNRFYFIRNVIKSY